MTSPLKFATFLINLDEDEDRLAWMAGQLQALGLAFTRFPAVRGNALPLFLVDWFPAPGGETRLKPGEIGCYASHLAVHRAFLADATLDAALVLEDDLAFAAVFGPLVEAFPRLPEGWDIVRLSNRAKAAYLGLGEIVPGAELIKYSRVPNNTGAYLISRSGAEKMAVFRGRKVWQIDEDMRRPWDFDLRTYGIMPPPIRSNIFDTSTIERFGGRGLKKEGRLAKLKRRRRLGLAAWKRRISWQIGFLGLGGWLRCVAEQPYRKIAERVVGVASRLGSR